MKVFLKVLATAALLSGAVQSAAFADVIKVGVIAPFSGPFAIWGKQFQQAIEVYVAQHGNKAGEHTVEFIYKDSGGPKPDVAKALAQELLIKDRVDYLGGLVFTPNALAVAPLLNKAKRPAVIFNAATSFVTTKSEYFVRVSFTLWQTAVPLAKWAYENGIRTVVTAVSDYAPGKDGEDAFKGTFEKLGGKVVDQIRMPLATKDFSPFLQRIKDKAPNAVYGFLPAGPPTFAFVKAFNENNLKGAGIEFLGSGETDETSLQALGDGAIGITTAYHYSGAHDSPKNKEFLAKLHELHPDAVANLASVGAYDGAHVLYTMIAAAGKDANKAMEVAKGMSWESPRGPVSIDPKTRHITQNIYMRKVAKDANGMLINKEFQTIPNVPDLGLQQ